MGQKIRNKYLKEFSNKTEINLGWNQVSAEGAKYILDALKTKTT
jgi:hypothetical protein